MPAGEYSHRATGVRCTEGPALSPCKGMDADHPFPEGASLPVVPMSRPRVLVADDDPRVLNVVSRYLALEGYEMSTVSDGEAAVGRPRRGSPT